MKMQNKVRELLKIVSPEQRTPEWYKMRYGKITASDGGTVVGVNKKNEPRYKFIVKKISELSFLGNKYTHHGKKYEKIATSIYEYRLNVTVDEYGSIGHPKYKFLGASPDGIIGLYKKDGRSLTKYAGRMVEIKCPYCRKIEFEGDLFTIVPEYYWVQVQLQLECTDLDECDFWQCSLYEYQNREEFLFDTDVKEPFRSRRSGYEKGCMIQLLPNKIDTSANEYKNKYDNLVYDHAKYIYPPSVEMTPNDCDRWVNETLGRLHVIEPGYCFDKILYWRLDVANCTLIKRDVEWFKKSLPILREAWDYVEFLRENKDKAKILLEWIDSTKRKMDNKIMKTIDVICNPPINPKDEKVYDNFISKLEEETKENLIAKQLEMKFANNDDDYDLQEDDAEKIDNNEYMF